MISQSSLSKQIKKLEEELQTELFKRENNKVSLTLQGEKFLLYARNAYSNWLNIKAQLSEGVSKENVINIATIDHLGKVGLTKPIADFVDSYPKNSIRLQMEKGTSKQVVETLLNNKCDLCFAAEIIDSANNTSNLDDYNLSACYKKTLLYDQYYAILPNNHKYANRKVLNWSELCDQPLMLLDSSNSLNGIVKNAFSSRGLKPNIILECGQTDTLLGMVADGLGITFLSGHIANGNYPICKVNMHQPLYRNTVLIAFNSKINKNNIIKKFINHIEESFV